MRCLHSYSSDGIYNMGWDFFRLHHVRVVSDVVVAHHRGGRGDVLLVLDLLGAGVVLPLDLLVARGVHRVLPRSASSTSDSGRRLRYGRYGRYLGL